MNNKNYLNLNSLSLQSFRSQFFLYPSFSAAQAPGYVAHHPYPIEIQKRKVEKEKGIRFGKGNKGRKEFINSGLLYDDRCYRMTNFEHLIDHYLMARDLGGDYIVVFEKMQRVAFSRCTPLEKIKIKDLEKWAILLEEGYKKASISQKKFFEEMSEEEYKNYCKKIKEAANRSEVRKKNSEGLKNYHKRMTPEEKEKYREVHKKAVQKAAQKISKTLKEKNRNLSEKEHEEWSQRQKESHRTPEARKNCSEAQKLRFLNESEEERQKRQENLKKGLTEYLNSLTPEKKEEIAQKKREILSSPEMRNKLKKAQKERREKETAEQKEKYKIRIKEWKKEVKEKYLQQKNDLKEKALSWNEFQKRYKDIY